MTIQSFEKNCQKIFKQVYPHVKDQKVGTLSSIIYLILNSDQAQELCQEYGIKKNANLDEDFDFSEDIIYTVSINKQKIVKENSLVKLGGDAFKNLSRPTRKSLNNREDNMEFIVAAAVILIGAYFTQKSLSKNRESDKTTPVLSSQPIPTAICLALPASAVYGLTSGKRINREQIIELIEAAPEFLCIKIEEADKQRIDTIEQEILPDSQLKFYIRIDIPNGQEIINAKTKYVIKRDIPINTEGEIIQIGRLRDASVLKSFNRI